MSESITEPAESTDWKSTVSEEYREGVSRFEDVNSMAKSYIELEKSMGSRAKLPDEKSTPEEVSAFYQKLGKPENPEGYSVPETQEGEQINEDVLNHMKQVAFEANIPQGQWDKIATEFMGLQRQMMSEMSQQKEIETEKQLNELKTEWGGDYDKNVEIGRRVINELVSEDIRDEFKAELERTGLGNSPLMIKAFNQIGSGMLDDTLERGSQAIEPEFVPKYLNSPELYATGEDEYAKKARAYFQAKGHKY